MGIVGTVFIWLWLLLAIPLSLCFLLFFWRPGTVTTTTSGLLGESLEQRQGDWRDLVVAKLVAVAFLSICYLMLDGMYGPWPDVVGRVASTFLLVAGASVFLWLAVLLIIRRVEVRENAQSPNDGDLFDAALEGGPAGALKDRALEGVARLVGRLPLGWLVLAFVPFAAAVTVLVGAWNLWHSGSPIQMVVPTNVAGPYHYLVALFEHIAAYLFFGGIIVAALGAMIGALASGKARGSEIRTALVVALVASVCLTGFVVTAGLWP